jgi:hypothetical protein
MCTSRHEERVQKIIVAIERLIAHRELDGDAVFPRAGGLCGDNQVILHEHRRHGGVPDPHAVDPRLWSRKINDDAPGIRQGGAQAHSPLDRLLTIRRYRERQVIPDAGQGGRALAGQRLRNTAVDGISGGTGGKHHQ